MPHEVKYKKPWESTPRGNVSMLSMRSTFHSVLSSHPFVHLTHASFINLSEIRELSVSILKCTLGEPGHHANWRTLSKVSVDSCSGQMLLLKLLATPALHIIFFCSFFSSPLKVLTTHRLNYMKFSHSSLILWALPPNPRLLFPLFFPFRKNLLCFIVLINIFLQCLTV